MATRMLIDARHREETRVAVLQGNRIEEFDFESAEHKQIKGNIYLAKVTRVEPSLQAAFVDFGGNRHGFLAFSEIHPDYYQIPHEDRLALLAEEAAHAEEEAALRAAEDDEDDLRASTDEDEDGGVEEIDTDENDVVATIEDGRMDSDDASEGDSDERDYDADDQDTEDADENDRDSDGSADDNGGRQRGRRDRGRRQGRGRAKQIDELRAKRQALHRRYKIQDVIQRRQVLLVQVVKEERGNKGAALTTYLSLAGRYCVLMPNSSHGGGISRKISSASDRKRLKMIVSDLEMPRSMGLIVRTAGLQRTKPEIKRDFDYLARLWDEIREKTLAASAPALIHSDSDLIKRAIRDIYNREIEEVVVEGEDGFKSAKAFMKLLMPSHVRRIKAYSDPVPLFQRYGAEDQLSAMYEPMVQLKSGGYLVINPTEALVSIDINSGRSTKEHGIEQTALSTNLEAAREIARQLRLRDMAGLVVIDFIDMEHNSNIRKVEKAMKDALKNDRARIQVGRISGFGLMEMSRQRLRTGVLEASTRECPHCDGTGLVRTASSAGLSALRLIEDEAAKGKGSTITLHASTEASIYLLNAKRADLSEIENRYGVRVEVLPEGEDEGAKMRAASSGPRPTEAPKFEPIVDDFEPVDEDEEEEETEETEDTEALDERGEDDESRRNKRRRRRGGRGRNRQRDDEAQGSDSDATDAEPEDQDADESAEPASETGSERTGDAPRKRRRRGGRRRRKPGEAADSETQDGSPVADDGDAGSDEEADYASTSETPTNEIAVADAGEEPAPMADAEPGKEAEAKPKPKRTRRKKVELPETVEAEAVVEAPAMSEPAEIASEEKPKRTRRKKAEPLAEAPLVSEPAADIVQAASTGKTATPEVSVVIANMQPAVETPANDMNGDGQDADGSPSRGGWWQRTFGP